MNEDKRKELQRFAYLSVKEEGREYINFLTKVMKIMKPKEWEKLVSYGDIANNTGMLYEIESIDKSVYSFLKKNIIDKTNKGTLGNTRTIQRQLNLDGKYTDKYVMANLETIIKQEMPDISDEDIKSYRKIIEQFQLVNMGACQNINFHILDKKYSNLFSFDQLSLIVSYPVIQDAILELTDSELECLNVSLTEYIDRERNIISAPEESDWNYETEMYLASLMSGEYEDVIKEISSVENEAERKELYKKLGYILSSPNFYRIHSLEELNNYSEIKRDVCKKIIEGEDLSEYPLIQEMSELDRNRFAVLQHFGPYSGSEMIQMFKPEQFKGQSRNEFPLPVIYAIKQLYEIDDVDLMRSIANDLFDKEYIPERDCSIRLLDKSIKTFLQKEYNKSLTDVSEIPEMSKELKEKFEIDDFEGEILDATDMDFSLMVTSIAPYSNDANAQNISNYSDYWNRQYKKAQFFCYSNITNSNISTAEIPYTLVGVSEIKGLQYAAPFDSNSNSNLMSPITESVMMFPLDELAKYNEMTEINSKRVTPTYIPLLKKYGELINLEQSQKASKDFGNIPIVFIDTDKIRYKQLEKNIRLIKQYKDSEDPALLPIIAQNMSFDEMLEDFYMVDEDEMDIATECFGDNSEEFKDFIGNIDLQQLIEELNTLEYADENDLHVKLEDVLASTEIPHNNNSQESLEKNTSDLRSSEIEQITSILMRTIEQQKEIGE